MKIINCEQRSEEWYEARLGIPTASNFDKIITLDGKPSKSRKKYMYQLAGEKCAGQIEPVFQSYAMQKGIDSEPWARKFYELTRNKEVIEVGFCLEDGGKWGASPDGMIGNEGLIEIKCPLVATHVEYLINNELPSEYFHQVQGQMFVTGREWTDFISYFPGLRPLIVREEAHGIFQKALKKELELFCEELNEIVKYINNG